MQGRGALMKDEKWEEQILSVRATTRNEHVSVVQYKKGIEWRKMSC